VRRWLRRRYGAGPLHLLALLACFALAGYAATRIHDQGGMVRIAAWFVLCIVGHDLIAWPLYALADRTAVRASRRHPERLPAVPWINHVRVPAVISGVLLLISFPLVLRLSEQAYLGVTGYTESAYLGNWLLVTGVAFGVSAVLYALRVARARRPAS
jgi:hypothetical protein